MSDLLDPARFSFSFESPDPPELVETDGGYYKDLVDQLNAVSDSISKQTADQVEALRKISDSLQVRVSVAERDLSTHEKEIAENTKMAKRAAIRSWFAILISLLAIAVQLAVATGWIQ